MNKKIKITTFEQEDEMQEWLNKYFDDIEIIQIYTTVKRSTKYENETFFMPDNEFHILFKSKEKVLI